jgi:hypothetical protein
MCTEEQVTYPASLVLISRTIVGRDYSAPSPADWLDAANVIIRKLQNQGRFGKEEVND